MVSIGLPQVSTTTTNVTSEQGGIAASTEQAVSESHECFEDLSM